MVSDEAHGSPRLKAPTYRPERTIVSLLDFAEPIDIIAIAEHLDTGPTHCLRMLIQLEREGYVEETEQGWVTTRRWRPSDNKPASTYRSQLAS